MVKGEKEMEPATTAARDFKRSLWAVIYGGKKWCGFQKYHLRISGRPQTRGTLSW